MYNALSGMGGAGQLDSHISAKANTALYATFSVFGFAAGTFLNYLGAKATLGIGGFGYSVLSASYLCYNHTHNQGFVIFAGALVGMCAAFLWCAQGTVMMSYPTEDEKGRYIGLFWGIFNLGAVIGSCIPIGNNWHSTENKPVNDGTYIGFLVLMVTGGILAWFLVPPQKIIRKDGTRVQRVQHPSILSEFKGLYETVLSDPYILLLFPFFWASNWFYTYQQNAYNLYMFNTRTRSFTGLWYWLAQIVASILFGLFLDNKKLSRRNRALAGWIVLFLIVNSIWGGGLKPELHMSRPPSEAVAATYYRSMDVYDRDFTWYCLLYVFYGMLDATWQTYAYWLMGALSNDPRKLAYFAGYYKGIQSAGAAVVWGLDSGGASYRVLFGTSWGLCAAGMLFALPVVWMRVHDTEITAEDFVAEKMEPETTGALAPAGEKAGAIAADQPGK
ncbi:major facilitator superfamily domain-containing protein [Sphaerosporella brunnea]|uniref:Major facilitator superfamily domain-containing protein n=1 Tax=Sphaerosporella brunnea TaxID=1250544 RepID=A0A5J5EVH3_9PEZI|nr:major facilitator superfamily domain-containing protein [Sphaerosporella brunnea]